MELEYSSRYKYDLTRKDGDVGFDICTPWPIYLKRGEEVVINTGLVVKMPAGTFAMIAPRSSSSKTEMYIANTIGIVDPRYCGGDDEIMVVVGRRRTAFSLIKLWQGGIDYLKDFFGRKKMYSMGDRFAQIVPMGHYGEITAVRRTVIEGESRGGFGSTGN